MPATFVTARSLYIALNLLTNNSSEFVNSSTYIIYHFRCIQLSRRKQFSLCCCIRIFATSPIYSLFGRFRATWHKRVTALNEERKGVINYRVSSSSLAPTRGFSATLFFTTLQTIRNEKVDRNRVLLNFN